MLVAWQVSRLAFNAWRAEDVAPTPLQTPLWIPQSVMGIGMVLVVSPHFAESIQKQLADLGHDNFRIGTVAAATAAEARVVLR